MKPFRISVPASSGNVGPGFDSTGLALGLYLHLNVLEANSLQFYSDGESISTENHFIWNIAEHIAHKHGITLPACKVQEANDIPLARGLGSSASAIVAGIELANQLGNLHLTPEQKLQYGTEIEGHPDNVAPSIYGGLIISTVFEEKIEHIQLKDIDVDIVAYIPNVELKTSVSRNCLPDSYKRDYAAKASAISNLTIAALYSKDYKLAGKLMEEDLFHEPFRSELIPNFSYIREEAKKHGAFGTILSGAGPTMLSITSKGKGATLQRYMSNLSLLADYQINYIPIDYQGITIQD
ncbi:homoserine kinase [Oceanobacillus kimchii]|uniref:homoserine kinase n=1 Tax=Oceanobacillus kimchii TaxID=746691 RepID=UPI00034B3789|nr:homoserine kinase [Oceanobacillus kimchii]